MLLTSGSVAAKTTEESEIDHIKSDITLIGGAGWMKVPCRKVEGILESCVRFTI